jgi:hypothetical protein
MNLVRLPLVAMGCIAALATATAAQVSGGLEEGRVLAEPSAIALPDRGSGTVEQRLAQGSTGGTLGKKDQSLSGGSQPSKEPPPAQRERKQPSYSLSGTWEFIQDCQIGTYRGTFRLSQTGAAGFHGSFEQQSPKMSGTVFDGVISGSRVSFKATFSAVETWQGSLSGPGRMQGTVTGSTAGGCTWTARRR